MTRWWALAVGAALLVGAALMTWRESFTQALGAKVLCPYGGTAAVDGRCCEAPGTCTPALDYQTPAPRDTDAVCPPGTGWGWGARGALCCALGAACVPPRPPARPLAAPQATELLLGTRL